MPEFTIIIPSWNNLPYLQKCVSGIRNNSKASHQIIVHVNEGADGTPDWLRKEEILFTHSKENIGICAGYNHALEQAGNELVMYMNDDMYVLSGWDEALLKRIPPSDYWMLSSTMLEPEESGNSCVVVADYGSDLESFREKKLLEDYSKLIREDWSGASWPPVMMPRHLWNKVGGFSIEYSPGMYSDPDLSMKAWQQGVRYFRGVGDSLVYHFRSKSTYRIPMNNGRLTFMKKWGITPSFFYKEYLKMGQSWQGSLEHSVNPFRERFNTMRVRLQTIFT